MRIDRFVGAYAYLSNFYMTPVVYEGDLYPSVEHAYQAAKTLDLSERAVIKSAANGGDAKRLGKPKNRGGVVTLRPYWELIKVPIMADLVVQKFAKAPLREWLLRTADAKLIEGNYWHDEFWGVCTCPEHGKGSNVLGLILMQTREGLRASALPQIKPENKLCWFCKHFYYSEAYPDYSEYTPGEAFGMSCAKSHWEFSSYRTTQEEFGKMLASARTCPDFVPTEALPKR